LRINSGGSGSLEGAVANAAKPPEQGSVFLSVKSSRVEKIAVHVPRNAEKRPVLVPALPGASIFHTAHVATELANGDVSRPMDVPTTAWRQLP